MNIDSSEVVITDCTVSGKSTDVAAYGSRVSKSLVFGRANKAKVFSGTYSHLNIFYRTSRGEFFLDQYNSVCTNCCLAWANVNDKIDYNPLNVTLRGIRESNTPSDLLADLNATLALANKGHDRQANFYVPFYIQLSNGSYISPGVYTPRGIVSGESCFTPISGPAAFYSTTNIGSMGLLTALQETVFDALVEGQSYYDMTNHRYLNRFGNKWYDASGNEVSVGE